MTAIIVSAIHFVNWSISTQTTCSRSESIGKHLDTDRAIVYTYHTAIERAGISTSYGKCSKRSHFDGESMPTNREFSGKCSRYCDFVQCTFTSRSDAFLTRYGGLELHVLAPVVASLFLVTCSLFTQIANDI